MTGEHRNKVTDTHLHFMNEDIQLSLYYNIHLLLVIHQTKVGSKDTNSKINVDITPAFKTLFCVYI